MDGSTFNQSESEPGELSSNNKECTSYLYLFRAYDLCIQNNVLIFAYIPTMLFYFSESVAAERLFTRSHQIYPVLSGQGSRVILETLGLSWEYTLNGMAVHLNALLSVNNWEMGYLDNFQSIYS